MSAQPILLEVEGLAKGFTLHAQGGVRLAVLEGIDLRVAAGECLVLDAPSGSGKSTLLRALYGNYRSDRGRILIHHRGAKVDVAGAPPRLLLELRRETIGYVSQFLRVIPRVPTLDLVAEPLARRGFGAAEAYAKAASLLEALALPERLWPLAPATFSGGEQQRVNIARALIAEHPLLLLDEPTAALDDENRDRVLALLVERRDRGTAMVGIFHDAVAWRKLATRLFPLPERTLAA
ncbi:MAG TPA: phosphonate C-P lyase system protein PhnL [Stellaceae bacterium]|nr:phosphonate C-P lyase system protein PhnL [Stellaceae bacterium]